MKNQKNWIIYKAVSATTGRVYVGCTSLTLTQRIALHVSAAFPSELATSRKSNSPFHNAIRELGIDDFDFEVIDETDDELFALEVLEPSYIELLGAYTHGYNACKGGYGKNGYVASRETLKKRSNSMKKAIYQGKYKPHHSIKGKMCITNGFSNRYIGKNDKIPKGWKKGTIRNPKVVQSLMVNIDKRDWVSMLAT